MVALPAHSANRPPAASRRRVVQSAPRVHRRERRMKTQVGWGVIGCSDIVKKRAGEAIRQQAHSRLVAFHARDLARAQAFAAEFGAQTAYDDVDRLLADDRIDAVYVATEVDRHAPLAIAAAAAGKHVLVEKPMALTAAEC